MASINRCLCVCVCVYSFDATHTHAATAAFGNEQQPSFWIAASYIEAIDNWRALAIIAELVGREWVSACAHARMRLNSHTHTYAYVRLVFTHICAFYFERRRRRRKNGRWAITFTCKFEWKISEVSNLLSSLSWQWAVDVNDLWWIFGPWSYWCFRFQFRKALNKLTTFEMFAFYSSQFDR